MSFLAGVDGGGTKTLVIAEQIPEGRQTRGRSGPSNPYSVGFDEAFRAIQTAIAQAIPSPEQIRVLCMGLAGVSRPQESEQFRNWATRIYPQAEVLVLNDAELTLAATASQGPVVVLICGTGSVVFGRDANGNLMRVGGWGYLFGDEGSGFSLGMEALRRVMQAYDGRAPATRLTDLILQARGCHSPEELIPNIYAHPSIRAEIASLAPLVEQAAQEGDAVARHLLEQAAGELTRMAAIVYRKLGNHPVPIGLSGGLMQPHSLLRQIFLQESQQHGLEWSSVKETQEPAAAALTLARERWKELTSSHSSG